MGLLDELDKNRSVFELIKNDEPYDKKRNVLSGEEVFNLCHNRYQLMQEILCPLKHSLGENITITDINFARRMQEDTCIVVWYEKDYRKNYFTISDSGLNDIEIESNDDNFEKYGVLINKSIIKAIFDQIDKDSLDDDVTINSTSKKFVVVDKIKNFMITDALGKLFTIEGFHFTFAKDGLMYSKERIVTSNSKLKEALLVDENILNIYRHLRVYEEDIPSTLTKKLTYR